jgi:hypothetical protein
LPLIKDAICHIDLPSLPDINASVSRLTCKEYSEDQMYQLEPAWRELYLQSDSSSVFSSWDWTITWWKHFQKYFPEGDTAITTLTAWKGSLLVGLAPFTYPKRQTYHTKRLRPVGDLEGGEGMTDEFPLLTRRDCYVEVVTGFRNYLANPPKANRWDCAYLRSMDSVLSDETCGHLGAKTSSHLSAPRIARLPDSWDQFYRSLSPSMKTNIKYYPRKLEKSHYNWKFRLASTVDEIRTAIPDLIRLHHERAGCRRGVKHCSHIPTALHEDFFTEVMITLAQKGEAWIGFIEIDGVTIASQAFMQRQNIVTFYYSGFDVRYYDYSPLLIISAEAIRHCINVGADSVNFLPDTLTASHQPHMISLWKSRWGAVSTGVTWEIAIYAPHARASAVRMIHTARTALQL